MYELKVLNNQPTPLSEKIYQDALDILNTLSFEQNPCQIDDHWTCIAYRTQARASKNCCIKSLTQIPCEQLWPWWCSTVNIACKSFFCTVAMQSFSEKNSIEIQKIRSMLRSALQLNQIAFDQLYYKKEETVRDYLSIKP